MSVHPSTRPAAAKGEAVPATGDPTAPGGDLFTTLVAGLNDAPADSATPGTPQQKGEAKAEAPTGLDVSASVEQLLALVGGMHGSPSTRGTKPKAAASEETQRTAAKTETDPSQPNVAPVAVSVLPILPTASPAPQAQATVPPDPLQVATPPGPTPQPAVATPDPAPLAAGLVQPVPAGSTTAPGVAPIPAAAVSQALHAVSTAMAAPVTPPALPDTAASPLALNAAIKPPAPAIVAAAPTAPIAATAAEPIPQTSAAPAPSATPPVPLRADATASPLPPAPAAQLLAASVAGKDGGKPATVERDRAISSPSASVPAGGPTADTRPMDPAILGSTAPSFGTDTGPASAATAAPLQSVVIDRQLDLAHQQDWIDQVARDIAGAAGGDGKTLSFRLNPEHLGTLQVEIAQSHHGAAVRFSTDSEAARSLIADAQPRLIAEARAQGVRISEAHVDLGGSGAGDPRRQPTAAPGQVQVRTARSLQDDHTDDGKPSPNQRDLYA